jgi:hypothetical protein
VSDDDLFEFGGELTEEEMDRLLDEEYDGDFDEETNTWRRF